ncbi:MAG: alpha-galactosidase [Streptosporangiaceae bacterium]
MTTPPTGPVPFLIAGPDGTGTGLVVMPRAEALPAAWAGPVTTGLDPAAVAAAVSAERSAPLLPEHGTGWFGRPGLSGYRVDNAGGAVVTGRDWSPLFRPVRVSHAQDRSTARIEAADETAGLRLATEVEAVPGGAIRARHVLTNAGRLPYAVTALEVAFPLPAEAAEILDFSGRHLFERTPQRHQVTDGLWLREGRRGHTGHDAATLVIAGVPGFGFGHGEVHGLHVAWSGNTVHYVERQSSRTATIGGGELLLPGEICLAWGESYTTPWVYLAAGAGLDELAGQFHGYLRSRPAHPRTPRPVNLNVWEAVYFDHDLDRLTALADLAAEAGVERYVLDDGWFAGRRDDHAGLGDWRVDEQVWPGGLHRLVDHVRARGLEFGLWFEPEMVNPDSDLYRAHPDWILSAGGRRPALVRNQLVLDLTRPEAYAQVLEQISAVLSEYDISYVKWDCNRDITDAGSGLRAGAPAAHAQAQAVYDLLDELRGRHPGVEWESCAGGGGRVDLGILERVERIWTSDMTDALARQAIQRWTGQLVPPEYLGAHVAAPFSHQTGRFMPLSLRCATALFGHFGVEWDITQASAQDLAELTAWIALYKQHRGLIHSGRVRRVDTPDDTAWLHGVVAADRSAALLSYVQLEPPPHRRPTALRLPELAGPGLDPGRRYRVTDITPGERASRWPGRAGPEVWPTTEVTGAVLAGAGLDLPAVRPLTAVVLFLETI